MTRVVPACVLLAIALVGLSACNSADDEQAAAIQQRAANRVEQPTINAALGRLSEFAKLRRLLRDTGLVATVNNPRTPMTLLAPRDTAFARMAPDQRALLLAAEQRGAVTASLRGLIIPRTLRSEELRTLIRSNAGTLSVAAIDGTMLRFTLVGDQFVVTTPGGASATMGSRDIETANGSIYVLDRWVGPGG
ncbi:MAG: fasciclin domain-containing protein [Sphingopyxis sp.]|nr:fasciclin domain-containing protein [Sphingopyxis sp.]